MIPSLEALSGRAAGASLNVPPPRFRPLGHISHFSMTFSDYCQTSQGTSEAQKQGLRYEAKVQEYLVAKFRDYNPEPRISILDDGVARQLRPDGLLIYPDRVFIFEIKYGHMPEAWWQLEKLYKVALAKTYHCPISLVEVCRSYDPAVPFPVPVTLIEDLDFWVSKPRDDFGVLEWRKTK